MPWRGLGRRGGVGGTGTGGPAGPAMPPAVLDEARLAELRKQGVPLAYDAAQNGWVPLQPFAAVDDAMTLRPWRAEDAAVFTALLDDPAIWRWLPDPYPDPLTEDLAADLIALSNAAPHHLVRAVEHDGVPVGQVRLAFAPGDTRQAEGEVSYWLGRAHWGAGLGRRMVAQFVAQVLADRAGLQALFARVHRDNSASAKVLQHAGFHAVGPAPDDATILLFRRSRDGQGGLS